MQNRIRKAQKGNMEAMLSLYDEHKGAVLSLCKLLLLEEKEANHGTAFVFKKLFEELTAGRIQTEEEFHRLLIRKTVMHCKALSAKKSSRAFRVPVNSDFSATVYDRSKLVLGDDLKQTVLANLPTFHRYVYVLAAVCNYSAEQLTRIFAVSSRIMENALQSEAVNVDKIVSLARRRTEDLPEYNIQDFHVDLVREAIQCDVPGSVDATVKLNVQSICEPILKAERKKGNLILGITGMAAVILVIFILIIAFSGGENPDVDLQNADPTTAEGVEATNDPTEAATDEIVASYYANIEIQDYGTITVALDAADSTDAAA